MNLPRFEHEWEGFKGHVVVKWDRLKEEELVNLKGDFSGLIDLISERYGEQKAVVESKLHEMYATYLETKERIAQGFDDISARTRDIAENIKEKASRFQQATKEQINRIREDNIDAALQKSEDYIKIHPFSTVLGAFGIGLLVGGLIGLLSNRD